MNVSIPASRLAQSSAEDGLQGLYSVNNPIPKPSTLSGLSASLSSSAIQTPLIAIPDGIQDRYKVCRVMMPKGHHELPHGSMVCNTASYVINKSTSVFRKESSKLYTHSGPIQNHHKRLRAPQSVIVWKSKTIDWVRACQIQCDQNR